MIILIMFEKLWHVNFFMFDKRQKHDRQRFKQTASVMFLDFWEFLFLDQTWNSLQVSYFSLTFFLEKLNYSDSVLCHCEMFDTTFGLDIGVCIVHAVIFIKKYLVNMFTISFNDFSKILIRVSLTMLKILCFVSFFKSGQKIVCYQKAKNITSSMLKERSGWCFWILNF